LRSPAQPETMRPALLPEDVPTERAMPMAVHVPTTVIARPDSFIDDLIRVFLDDPRNREQEPHAGKSEPIK
jgi:hypothetical protein